MLTMEVFKQLKRKELAEKHARWYEGNDLNRIVDALLAEYDESHIPDRHYQMSKGTQYATDDECFLSFDQALTKCLEESVTYPDEFFVVWAFESDTLPFPVAIAFDGKAFMNIMVVAMAFQ